MNFQKRKGMILNILENQDSVDVPELSTRLGVSEITVRRDLNVLAEKGLLVRTHGGAISSKSSRDRIGFANKTLIRQEEKEFIARLAAQRVDDGDTIFLDCGSTVFCLAPYLKSKKIKVITNSLPLAYALLNSHVQINLIGGEVDQERMSVHGAIAVQHITRYSATKAFIGVDGISLGGGLSANSESEAEISMAMAQQSKEVYLLCDSSKLEQDKYLQFAPLTMIDWLITDKKAPEEILKGYRKEGIRTIS
jgi:DeoR family transcriptional regulator, fructose operon transcriptional repressor